MSVCVEVKYYTRLIMAYSSVKTSKKSELLNVLSLLVSKSVGHRLLLFFFFFSVGHRSGQVIKGQIGRYWVD